MYRGQWWAGHWQRRAVRLAKAGDGDAYQIIVETYQGLAFRTAYLLTGNAADAEEAAQDAFLKAFRALGRFRLGSPLRPWLLRIVANEARNRRRAAGTAHGPGAAGGRRAKDLGGRGPVPRGGGARPRGAGEALLRAVESLPEQQRVVIGCRFFLDLSEEETAAVVGVRRAPSSRARPGPQSLRELHG